MENRIVKTWTDHYYNDPITGMVYYRPKTITDLVKVELKCTMYRSGETIDEDRFMAIHEGEGGPIAIGDSIEDCETKFNEMLMMSLVMMGGLGMHRKDIERILREFVLQFPRYLTEYKNGNSGLLGLYVGHVMKTLKGKGEPFFVNEVTLNFLKNM